MSTTKGHEASAMPTAGRRNTKRPRRESVTGAKASACPNCRHCGASDCTVHCPATKNGRHEVEFGDMQVEESGPALVVVEIFCKRCSDRASAVVVESNFIWEGQWRDEVSDLKPRRGTR